VKIAVLARMPSARDSTAITVKAGLRNSPQAILQIVQKTSILDSHVAERMWCLTVRILRISWLALEKKWRRERDSNPRYPFRHNGFQDRRYQPLTHPSA
jgi:hypothetical protein